MIENLLDAYIALDKYVKQHIPHIREYLEYLGLCKKENMIFQKNFRGKNFILYKRTLNDNTYIRMMEEMDEMPNVTDIQIEPLEKKPFIYVQVIRGNEYIDIYDFVKAYFVKGNVIDRTLIEFIVWEHTQVDLSKDDYNIHMFTHDAKLKVYDKQTVFSMDELNE